MRGDLGDRLGRPLKDLRISVTDRCNFRCRYCMPREVFGKDFPFLERGGIMSFEEIDRFAGIFIDLGFSLIWVSRKSASQAANPSFAKICQISFLCFQ